MSQLTQENLEDIYVLTPLQEGMLFHALNPLRPTAYFEQFHFRLEGVLDRSMFEEAWRLVIRRHPALRTMFAYQKTGRPLQMVLKDYQPEMRFFDWGQLDAASSARRLAEFLLDDRLRPFELNKTVPMRWSVIQLGATTFQVIWSHHHLLLDGWGGGIVFSEFLRIYAGLRQGRSPALPPAPPFANFVRWLESRDQAKAAEFWRKYLQGYETAATLPRLQVPAPVKAYRPAGVQFHFAESSSDRLRRLAAEWEVTLNSLVQCLWGIFLCRLNNTADAAFLAIVSGRNPEVADVEQMAGLLINAVPVRFEFKRDETVANLARATHARWLDCEPHDHASLAEIQAQAGLNPGLLDHLMVFVNYPMDGLLEEARSQGLGFHLAAVEMFEHSNYDFEILIHPEARLRFDFKFNECVYDQPSVQRLADCFQQLVGSVLADPLARASGANLVPSVDQYRILAEFNPRNARMDGARNVPEWFELHAARTPDAVAVIAGERALSYGELNRRANRIAHALRDDCGIKPGDLVGVLLERDEWVPAALLGVLKAGGAYVPVDPSHPVERMAFVLRESQCRVLLAEPGRWETSRPDSVRQVLNPRNLVNYPAENPRPAAGLDDPAYVIYTSGSTGVPKGCVVAHGNVLQLFKHDRFDFQISERDVWMLAHSFGFDFSVWELFGALLFGGSVVIAQRSDVRNISAFLGLIRRHRISVLSQTPGAFYELIKEEALESRHDLGEHLRYVVFGGDRLEPAYLAPWIVWYPLAQVRLINMYGITETTVHVTFHEISQRDVTAKDGGSPIGRPLPPMEVLVCDSDLNLLPIGVIGEMYVGGGGVCRGYLNRPDLTAARFVAHPFRAGEKLYKSGDLGRWLPDGKLEFHGRNDDQIQIRGFRVEPAEIERRLLAHPSVKEAVVLALPVADSWELCAYLVLRPGAGETLATATLREHLLGFVPDYMVPNQFVSLAALPLTGNGKIDKAALRLRRDGRLASGATFVAPRNALETQLAQIWQEVLQGGTFGVRDGFYDVGGHSLKATQLVSRVRKRLGVDLPLREFLDGPTIEQLANRIQTKRQSVAEEIPIVAVAAHYELSNAQRRLWVIEHMKAGGEAYHLFSAFRLAGPLRVTELEAAFAGLIERHEVLRTGLIEVGGMPRQHIIAGPLSAWTTIDLRGRSDPSAAAAEYCAAFVARPFNLAVAPLFRVGLARLGEAEYVLTFCFHHVIVDGWSLSLLARELAQIYEFGARVLPPLRLQYKDYSDWQRRLLTSGRLDRERQYWREKLGGELPVLALPTDYPRPAVKTFAGRCLKVEIPAVKLTEWRRCAQESGATLFMYLVAGLKILLQRYCDQEDIIVGAPISGRPHADLENQVGYYLNTLALRTTVRPTDSFRQVLEKVKTTATEAYDHQLYPFDALMDELDLRRDTSRAVIFDVLVGLQNQEGIHFALPGVQITELTLKRTSSKFDLTLSFTETDGRLALELEYNCDLFGPARMARLPRHFVRILDAGAAAPDQSLFEVDLVSAEERASLLERFNPAPSPYPDASSLAALFEEQVRRHPDALAVFAPGEELTYAELDARSNQVAGWLRHRGETSPEELIGLFVDRSPWMIVGILGILKAGCAYVPLDTAFPPDRLRFVLNDSKCRLVITEDSRRAGLAGLAVATLVPADLAGFVAPKLMTPGASGGHLAYVMYTSGSSGPPKGVLVEQRSVTRLVRETNYCDAGPGERILQLSNYAFDGSVFDIFGALLNGAALYLPPAGLLLDLHALAAFILEHKISISFITTALFNNLVDIAPAVFGTFKRVYFGGQDASLKHVATAWRHTRHPGTLAHVYGPTETTTFATFFPVTEPPQPRDGLPIGAAIANTTIYILDEFKRLQPVGVPGEIYVGGPGVARGYLNQPELTRERFLPDPIVPGGRVYRTGDWGRWTESGQVLFLGRRDRQVKVRGYRVELAEVENALLRHPDVLQACVSAPARATDGTRELVAHFVPRPGAERRWTVAAMRSHLAPSLPDYMIPAHFVALASLPLTPNGKVNLAALPPPQAEPQMAEAADQPPASENECMLLGIWREILGDAHLGPHDNYFAAGGDSIKAIQMSARLHERGLKLDVSKVFQHQTVAELAAHLTRQRRLAPQVVVSGPVPLTGIQAWFFSEFGAGRHHFNQSVLLQTQERLEVEPLAQALALLQSHHDALRLTFTERDGVMTAHNRGLECPVSFVVHDLRDRVEPLLEMGALAGGLQAGFDLACGPLIRSALFRLPAGDRLLLAIHHLAVDGVSWRILVEDLRRLYEAGLAGSRPTLPAKTDSYQSWAEAGRGLMDNPRLHEEIPHWASLPLAADWDATDAGLGTTDGGLVKDSATLEWSLSAEDTQALLNRRPGGEHYEVPELLLTALMRAVEQWAGLRQLVLALESHGRELELFGDMDFSRTVGWFTALYPVIFDWSMAASLDDLIAVIRQSLRQVPRKGAGYGWLRFVVPGAHRELPAFQVRPRISFNYLGQFDDEARAGLFELSQEPQGSPVHGELRRAQVLDFVGMVAHGKLRFSLIYPARQIDPARAGSLHYLFHAAVRAIANHTFADAPPAISAPDYGGLTDDQLDALVAELPAE